MQNRTNGHKEERSTGCPETPSPRQILNPDPTEVTAYTDGLAVESNSNSDAGVIIVAGGNRLEIARTAGFFTSSYQAKLVALNTALKTCLEKSLLKSMKVITDSLSVVNRMEPLSDSNSLKSHLEEQTISHINETNDRGITPHLIWCPSHMGIDRN